MKRSFIIFCMATLYACSANRPVESKVITNNTDSLPVMTINEKNYLSDTVLPRCMKELISQFKQEEKQNPPRSVYSYVYDAKTVYYVPAICCDFFSDLYDDSCKLIAHPDGGFTGRGDGTLPDFITKRTNEKLIWKDER